MFGLLVLGGALLAGCSAMGHSEGTSITPADMASGASAPVQPGDRMTVKIWADPQLSDTFVVAESGVLTLPKLGSLHTQGISAGALQDSVRRAYAAFVRDPAVQASVLRRVAVLGEVRRPGVYLADLTTSMADVIAMAGGLTESANPNAIVVQRGGRSLRVRQADHASYLRLPLLSGDQIVVGARSFWARNPAVTTSTVVSLVAILLPYVREWF